MTGMIDVGGIDPFPNAGQSQHFYDLKTDVVCVNTVTSLKKETLHKFKTKPSCLHNCHSLDKDVKALRV